MMNSKMLRLAVILITLSAFLLQVLPVPSAFALGGSASMSKDGNYIRVEAEGKGKNRNEALENAWIEAVRMAVGVLISSKTQLENDKLSESIIVHSRGAIDMFKVMKEETTEKFTIIKIFARVRKDIIEDITRIETKPQIVKANTKKALERQRNEQARDVTNQMKQRSGAALLREELKDLFDNYTPDAFYSVVLNPDIRYDERTRKSYILIREKFNNDLFWNEFLPKLHKVFENSAVKKSKHFYIEKVRAANERLAQEAYLESGGIFENPDYRNEYAKNDMEKHMFLDWCSVPYSWALNGELGGIPFYPHRVFSPALHREINNEPLRAILPNDNTSFTVYTLPVRITGAPKSLADYQHGGYEDPEGILPVWMKFFNKMIAPVTVSIHYLDENGATIKVQAVQFGAKHLMIYRSIYHHSPEQRFYIIPSVLTLAPGFSFPRVFLDSINYDKKYGGETEINLNNNELERLDSMKIEVVFENQ